jgi:hypothetical protein
MIISQQKSSFFIADFFLDILTKLNISTGTQNTNSSFDQRRASFLYFLCHVNCFPTGCHTTMMYRFLTIPLRGTRPAPNINPTSFYCPNNTGSRCPWQLRLRHVSAAVYLLGQPIRIPSRAWMSVSVVCCQEKFSVSG